MPFYEIMQKPFVEKANRCERNLKKLEQEKRTDKSVQEIREIFEKYSRIKDYCIPEITGATGHNFIHENLFLFVILYKEINAVFNEAQTNPIKTTEIEILGLPELREMTEVAEDRMTLAHIGDAALESGVMASIWPDDPTIIPRKKFLHDERKKLVENFPLSQFWDSLHLYDSTVLVQLPCENQETKGSYIEAVFGIIFLEGGLPAVETSLRNLKTFYDKKK